MSTVPLRVRAEHAAKYQKHIVVPAVDVKQLLDNLDTANAALDRIRALHIPEEYSGGGPEESDGVMCQHCLVDDGATFAEYPCPTIRALDRTP